MCFQKGIKRKVTIDHGMLEKRKGMDRMLAILQRFVKEKLAYIIQQEDIQFIYEASGELVGEIHTEKDFITHIDFYDADLLVEADIPFSTSAMINAVVRPNDAAEELEAWAIPRIALEMKEALDDRALKLDCVVDFDVNYLAVFEEVELRYGLTIPNTGLQLAIKRDGTLSSATFLREPFTIIYPEHIISTEEARQILNREPLLELSISQEDWQYVYVPTFDVYGVETDGRLKRLGGKTVYEPLPEIEPLAGSLEDYLQGGRTGSVQLEDEEDTFYWEFAEDENTIQPVCMEPAFERACRALQAVVGSSYSHYQHEQITELEVELPLAWEDTLNESVSYRFVYFHEGIPLSEHAAEIAVQQKTGQIEYISVPKIPFERLAVIKPPVITLEEANERAKQLVDVTLSMERVDLENNLYTVVYVMEYPSSPTQGDIEFIDAYSGEIRFVDTGLMKIEE